MLYKNRAGIDYSDKEVLYREYLDTIDHRLVFKKIKSKDEKKRIKKDALGFYVDLLSGKSNRMWIESGVSKEYQYKEIYSSTTKLPNGTEVNDSDYVYDYEIKYNPYYYDRFVKEINKLARKDELYIKLEINEDQEWGDNYIVGNVMRKEEFEDTYSMSLEQYYNAISKNKIKGKTREEDLFRKEITKLIKYYVKSIVSEIDEGFDPYEGIGMEGYNLYCEIASRYVGLPNKEEILEEYGFKIDDNYRTLEMISNKSYKRVIK